jgi:hypothetical protein
MPAHKGSAHHRAVLTEEDVRKARKAYHREGATIGSLAVLYMVTEGAMRRAVNGVTWGHVKDYEDAGVPDAA